jgi:hypothetical protein
MCIDICLNMTLAGFEKVWQLIKSGAANSNSEQKIGL